MDRSVKSHVPAPAHADDGAATRRRYPAWHLVASLLACLLLATPAAAQGQAVGKECQPSALLGAAPGQAGTVVICSTPLRADPAFKALVGQLNALSQRNAELAGAVQKLTPALNGGAQGLTPGQLSALATNVARRLTPGAQASDSVVLREVQRLQLNLEELQERLTAALADRQNAAHAPARPSPASWVTP